MADSAPTGAAPQRSSLPPADRGRGRSGDEALPPRRPVDRQRAVQILFRDRDFRLLWIGQLLSQIGDQCLLIAAITLITDLTSDPRAILIPAISVAVPQLVFGLVGGVMADRWNRKLVMVGSDVLRGIVVLSILLVRDVEHLWILYLAAAGLGLMGVFFYPARNAAIPNIVPPHLLLAANSLIQGSYVIALIVGPVAAGMAVELWLPAAVIFDSATFAISALIIAVMRIPAVVPAPARALDERSVWKDMKAGLDFIRRSQALGRVLVVTAVATLGVGAIVVLAIPHLEEQLEAGGMEYGVAMSMLGAGSVIGGLLVNRISQRLSTAAIVSGMLILAGVAIVAFAFAPNYAVVLVSIAVIGLCVVMARGALDTISQALAPDAVRGRVQSAVNLIVVAGTTLSEGVSPLLASHVGVQAVFVAAGVLTALAGLGAALVLRGAARQAGSRMVWGKV